VSAINPQDRERLDELVALLQVQRDATVVRLAVELAYRHGIVAGERNMFVGTIVRMRAA
jgi:hypothetical protein